MLTEEQTFENLKKDANFEITPCCSADFNGDQLKKLELSSSQKSQMSFLWSQMPMLAATSTISQAYIVRFPEGISGALMAYKNPIGGSGSPIVGSNGSIIGHASFHELPIQTTLLTAFSVMSIATGQYFLSNINNELKLINQKIDKVIDFLYGDKKAELISEISFVQDACKNFNSMMSHESHRVATIIGLQESKKVAIKDIEFYLCDLDAKANSSVKSYSEFSILTNEAFQIQDSLDLSIQLYVMSSIMETYYAQNNDLDYINTLRDDMIYYINKCDKRILSYLSKLNGRNGEYKSTPIKKVDTSLLDQKFNKFLISLNNGERSNTDNIINSALNPSRQPSEYYVNKEGDVYIKPKL